MVKEPELQIFYAAKNNDVDRIRFLLANGVSANARAGIIFSNGLGSPFERLTPLHVAVEYNAQGAAELLLKHGADPNAKNLAGETPLHAACKATFSFIGIAEILISHGANLGARDSDRNTPLMKAVEGTSNELVALLIKNGADVNAQNDHDETPLLQAVRFADASDGYGIVKLLLDNGANPNAADYEGTTAIKIATKRGDNELIAMLHSHGAKDSDIPTYAELEEAANAGDAGRLQELFSKLPNRNLVNWRNENGAGLLWGAAAQNRPEIVKLLLKYGADPKLATNDGETPLHETACHMANEDMAEQEKAVNIATMLLKAGADVNAKTDEGITPINYATVNHQDRMVKLLQQYGAQ